MPAPPWPHWRRPAACRAIATPSTRPLLPPYFRDLLDAAGVPVLWSDGVETVDRTDRAIREIITRSGVRAHGRIFIDASYEGDLMARAGINPASARRAVITAPKSRY